MSARDTDGYSLLELLVALALTAVIATMMVAVTRQLHPLRQIQAKYDTEEIAARLASVIGNDLQSAIGLQLIGSDSLQPVLGTPDTIRFVGVVRTGFETEGLREVSYQLKPRPDGTNTLVRTITLRRFAGADASIQSDDLYDPVQSLTFRYMDRDTEGKVVWLDHWDRPSAMPSAVKVTVGIGRPNAVVLGARVVMW